MLQSHLMLLHQILNRIPTSLTFITLRLPAACTVLHFRMTCLLLRLLGHINLAALRSEALAPVTVQNESQTEREHTKDQRNRETIVQKCKSPGTGCVCCASSPSSSERGTAKSTWNLLRVACAGTDIALEG